MNNFLIRKRQLIIALVIVLVALVFRVAFVLFYPAQPLAGGDPKAYWSFAEGIVRGAGFASDFEPWLADRPPLYSYFLALVFNFIGKSESTVFFVQAVLGSFAAGLFYLCSFRILGDVRSIIVGMSFAAFPAFLLFTKQVLSEQLYLFLFVVYLCTFLLPESITLRSFILSGILFGLLALTRREAVLPASLILMTLLWLRSDGGKKQFCVGVSVSFIIGIMVLTPWLIRNWQVFGKPLLSSSAGWNFMVGNNPGARGGYTPPPLEWRAEFDGLGELERNKKAWELSLAWIRDQPLDFIQLLPQKIWSLWSFDTGNILLSLTDVFVYFFSFLGIFRLFQRDRGWQAVAAISFSLILSTTFVSLIFVGGWRYHFIAYPGILLLGGIGIPHWFKDLLVSVSNRLSGTF